MGSKVKGFMNAEMKPQAHILGDDIRILMNKEPKHIVAEDVDTATTSNVRSGGVLPAEYLERLPQEHSLSNTTEVNTTVVDSTNLGLDASQWANNPNGRIVSSTGPYLVSSNGLTSMASNMQAEPSPASRITVAESRNQVRGKGGFYEDAPMMNQTSVVEGDQYLSGHGLLRTRDAAGNGVVLDEPVRNL